jgi:photosystem II stability/assembly factor-like uncharacterized protein
MKNTVITIISVTILIPLLIFFKWELPRKEKKGFNYHPSEWFYLQRSYPGDSFPVEKYLSAFKEKESFLLSKEGDTETWQPVGPYNIGGRITALCVDYDDNNIIYAGAAAGGVFKSTDKGISWTAKTDFFPSLSIGAMQIDPNNRSVIYCGTGEANSSGDSYPGFGLLKSTDAGETWFLSGLESSRHIAQIQVHPLNSNIIYVAATGGLYTKDNYRGIYKSTDAGASWEHVLFVSDSTSAIDVDVDPTDINIVYAAFWERIRTRTYRKAAGLSSGIYKSTDGGNNWTKLSNGLPVNDAKVGRISIAVAESNPNYVYALYKSAETENGTNNYFYGFYRSTNRGENWTKMQGNMLDGFSSFGWYFGLIDVDPLDHNKVIVGEVDLYITSDGGNIWSNISNSYSGPFDLQHPDQHSLWINPYNTQNMIVGNDGGIFITTNRGYNWEKFYDLPVSQFYASAIDYQNPDRVMGGTQDNGTLITQTGNLSDWIMARGGDGFHCAFDYSNSNYVYSEYQWGGFGRSTDGGQSFISSTNGLDLSRTNWSTPFIIDPVNPTVLYLGSYKLHISTNRGISWQPVSNDLTNGPNGRMGTITCISAAVAEDTSKRVLYVGTDDTRISLSTNSGSHWFDITGDIPDRYITDILCDQRNPAIAYITLSGFNMDLSNPHIFRTTDYGSTWNDISGNLPDVPLNSVIIDYDHDSVLYVGGDLGVYYTTNLGGSWQFLGTGLPNSPVFDLNYHQPTKQLFAATHGRSIYKIDISSITSTEDDGISQVSDFVLYQNYPNPFNPVTTIKFSIPSNVKPSLSAGKSEMSNVKLIVYDLLGNEVATLVNEDKSPGEYEVTFDGSSLASGIYFYRLTAGSLSKVRKLVLLK